MGKRKAPGAAEAAPVATKAQAAPAVTEPVAAAAAPAEQANVAGAAQAAPAAAASTADEAKQEKPSVKKPVAKKAEKSDFTGPDLYCVKNNTPSRAAFPVIDAMIPAHDSVVVEIGDESQFKRFRSEAESICELNGWQDGFTIERAAE